MDQTRQILDSALALIARAAGAALGQLAAVEAWLRLQMAQLGVPSAVQTAVLVAGALLLFLAAFRLLGFALRVLLLLCVIALAVQAFGPVRRPAAPVRHTGAVERQAAGTPLVVEYSKCSATSGCTSG